MSGTFIRGSRSCVNSWECDENNHLNVRFYMTRLAATGGFVAEALGVAPDHALIAATHHIRYRRELRAGDMAEYRTRVVEVRESSVVLHHQLMCAGEVATSFVSIERHIARATGAAVPWSDEQRRRMALYAAELPQADAPRSVAFEETRAPLTLEAARERGLVEIYRGMVEPWDCDVSGRMAWPQVMGRISDGVGNLFEHLGLRVTDLIDSGRGSVVVENRLTYDEMPAAGDLIIVHSQVVELVGKIMRFSHNMFNGVTGARIAGSEVMAAILDHASRRAVALSEAEEASVRRHLTPLD